jgi:hypothetical protein
MPDGLQLAQVNIARMCAPLESQLMADFVAAIEPINALADAAPGFVWRLQLGVCDATLDVLPLGRVIYDTIRAFDDDTLLITMSVWSSFETLMDFVYRSDHSAMMRRRQEWFEQIDTLIALWWIPTGELPTPADARERLDHLAAHGPTPYSFNFRRHFEPGAGTGLIAHEIGCPA